MTPSTGTSGKRFRYLAKVQKGRLPTGGVVTTTDEGLPYLTMEYLRGAISEPAFVSAEPGLPIAEDGDLLLLWDGSNAGEFIRAKRGAVSSTVALVTPKAVDDGYFYWACKFLESQVRAETVGMGIPHVNGEVLANLVVPLPDAFGQRAIADYLDREAARLDALVVAKERVLGLLAEKRRALITRAVTRGLDPRAPIRDSGIPWLGEIPAHWRLERAKFVFRQSALPVRDEDEMVTCFRDGQVTLRRNRREEGFTNANLELGYQGIRAGQLVLHSMDAFAGAIGVSDSDGKCSPEYIICDPQTMQVDSYYYGHLLRSMALAGFIQASCPAVRERAPRIRFSDFGEMFVPVPPLGEQRSIVERIRIDLSRLEAHRTANERTIALLKERRATLIAATVTGLTCPPKSGPRRS